MSPILLNYEKYWRHFLKNTIYLIKNTIFINRALKVCNTYTYV